MDRTRRRRPRRGGQRLAGIFGRERLYVEIQRHRIAGEERWNAFLVDWARAGGLPLLATNGVLHATPEASGIVDVFTCLRHHTTLDAAGRRLVPNRERHLKDGSAMAELFADLPDAVANSGRLAQRIEFTLANLGLEIPGPPRCRRLATQDSFLHKMTYFGAQQRYGSVVGEVRRQLERELALIAKQGLSGYFLIVWDLCSFAREREFPCPGAGERRQQRGLLRAPDHGRRPDRE